MFTRVAMTAKNTVTMSDGPRGSAGTFPSRLEARVCQILRILLSPLSALWPRLSVRSFDRKPVPQARGNGRRD